MSLELLIRLFQKVIFILENPNTLGITSVAGDEVAKVGKLVVGITWWLWQIVVSWVEHDVALLNDLAVLVGYYDFEGEE